MDWDDVRPPQSKSITIGEPLDTASIADLKGRVAALEAEIVRVKAEIDRKQRQTAAANALFKS